MNRYIITTAGGDIRLGTESMVLELLRGDPAATDRFRGIAPGETIEYGDISITSPSDNHVSPNVLAMLWQRALDDDQGRELFVAQWWHSGIIPGSDPQNLTAAIGRIWDCAHMDVKSICRAANLTQTALAARFGIPKRTVEDWCAGKRSCAPYIRRMMCEILVL